MDHRVWKKLGTPSLDGLWDLNESGTSESDGSWGLEDGEKLQIWMDCGVWKMVGILSLDGLWGSAPLKNTNHLISHWKLLILSVNGWMEEQVRCGETLRQIFLRSLVCLAIQDPNLVVHLPTDVS